MLDPFAHYRQLESLRAYLLIAQDRVAADLYLRQDEGTWNLQSFDHLAAEIALPTIAACLALAEVYDKVDAVLGARS
jgi:hypothetical protein